MIITNFIVTSVENLQRYQEMAEEDKIYNLHGFTILSVEDVVDTDHKKMTFSIDSNRIAYFMISVFHAGVKSGFSKFKTILDETAY